MSSNTITRLEASRKELLDLGLRNPLINHRARAKQVMVIDELSSEIFRILVTEGRKMSFGALSEKQAAELAERNVEEDENGASDNNDGEVPLAQPDENPAEEQLAKRHIDNKLQTNLVSEKLQTRLLSIHNDARTYLEEQGVNVLYLALGFLEWYEAPSAYEPRRAPLLLIPVGLQRTSAQQRFQLFYTGEDIGDNLSLSEKLKAEFRIELPQIEHGDELDVNTYMESVAEVIQREGRWQIKPDEMTLGFFSFGKLLMYKDLEGENWSAEMQGKGFSILDALLSDGFNEPSSDFNEETYIDEVVSPATLHLVKDADSTQTLAILDVMKAGRNLVLQGPPGTGKSQTITNIIAAAIGEGKKVLFVSEKMAALDVVKRRLDQVFLGDAVIELHSYKTNKKQVLAELDRTLHQGCPVGKNAEDDIVILTQLRDELNAYCSAVNQPIGNTRISFINALGFALENSADDIQVKPFAFEAMSDWSESEYRSARMAVETLDGHIAKTGAPDKNPFKASMLTEFLPSQRSTLEDSLADGTAAIASLCTAANKLTQSIGLATAKCRADVELTCSAARRAVEGPNLDGINLTSDLWQARKSDLFTLIAAGRALNQCHARYDEWVLDAAWDEELLDVRQHYITKGSKWWRFLSGDFRRAKARLLGLSRKPLPWDAAAMIEMIDAIILNQRNQGRYNVLSELGCDLFGAQWNNVNSKWGILEKITEWVIALHHDVSNGAVPTELVSFLSNAPDLEQLKERVDDVESRLLDQQQSMELVQELLKLNPSTAESQQRMTLAQLNDTLAGWLSSVESLQPLVRFNQLAEELSQRGIGFVVSVSRAWPYDAGTLLRLFDYSWFNGLVEKAYAEQASIRKFNGVHHSKTQENFSRLDRLLLTHSQTHLALKHWHSLPRFNSGGELNIINREINKKRRHMPIRRLMQEAGRAIQAIKPVFMMSPMSIATYVPPGSVRFDLVIFDEASQVKPVDAFGAIIRGNQTVVVGDSKQLPPTSFFESLVESRDEEEFESVGDMESILSLFLGQGAPERMLRWHYRSRHDSLIAVSNYEFYDNRLVVFPCPGANPAARGLRLHCLPDTAYERGRSASNPEEAKAVALAIMEHAKRQPDLSLGVAAFSVAQRDAIEMQLEHLRRADPRGEPFFNAHANEPFFIKNLENVQGDERDVVFVSIGYGKDPAGYLAMNFGPLNRDGGERRLNVLITRARLAMDVFSNFTADDIDLSRSNARGVAALKSFLTYAESGNLQQAHSTGKPPDSPFEEAVIKALVLNGVEVEPQVGTAGFFIDIAVKDAEKPGRYILGIECDGATYHSSRSARDRDRLRQEVLEGLGWRLHRIWSTEWYRNPEQELKHVLAAIDMAKLHSKKKLIDQIPKARQDNPPQKMQRDISVQRTENSNDLSMPYQRASLCINLKHLQLPEIPSATLLSWVLEVVKVESPIHKNELLSRILEGAGIKRTGARIKAAVLSAINLGKRQQQLVQKGDFIWHPKMSSAPVRDRSELAAAEKKFEFVVAEEIQEALRVTVENGFSMSTEEAFSCAARLLGFQRVTAQIRAVFEKQLKLLIENKTLEVRSD